MSLRSSVRVFIVVLLGAAMLAPSSGVAGQASPESAMENPFADLGLQQIDITMTDSAFEGVPSELEAGRYVVAFTNTIEDPFFQGGAFMQVPEGMTPDEFMQMAAPMESTPAADDMAMAESSPMAEGEGESEGMGPPEWYYQTAIAGGPYALSGQTVYMVVELTEGDWVFWAEYPGAPQAPAPISVTGEIAADAPTPEADVTVEMSEFAFTFSSELTPGTHVIEVSNVGEQPHFMLMAEVPDGTTVDDIAGLVESDMSMAMGTPAATPEEGALSLEDVQDVFNTGDQSAGVTAWYTLTIGPGTFGAVCFVPDPESGMPHAMLGMIEVIVVAE